ncbi:MAG: vWA domain-containing protein [Pseudomonadota bacterium]|nr:vWA domain-containing protein [Pseudomonadota bacterium]
MLKPLSTLVLFLVLLFPAALSAQSAPGLPDNADVRLIVDISGSMKKTDPDNLRRPAVRLLAGMLPGDASAGLWTFGQYVNMLVPHGTVDEAWRETVRARSAGINSVALRTNLGKAIEVASDDYYSNGTLENTHFILLTDGKVDIAPDDAANREESKRILEKLVPRLAGRGATFHTIALSDAADTDMLRAIADASGGSYSLATSADELNRVFLRALNAAVPQEQLPIEGNRFTVDSGVKEFTALIFRGAGGSDEPLSLVDPGGNRRSAADYPDNTRWLSEQAYDLITVKSPQAGEWRIAGEPGEGSRVTVVSDLRMVVSDIPSSFGKDDPVRVRVAFYEDEQQLLDPEFLGLLRVTLTLTAPDGRSGTKVLSGELPPRDGIYRDTIGSLPDAGDYRLTVLTDGYTFSRKFTATLRFVNSAPGGAEPALPPGDQGPIDLSEVEEPEPLPEPAGAAPDSGKAEPKAEAPRPVTEEEAGQKTAWLLTGGIGAAVLAILGGALLWFLRRRKQGGDEEPASDTPLAAARTPEEAEEAEVPVVEKVAEPEPEPEQPPEPDDDEDSDELAEFGLEDFDLSEFDDLPGEEASGDKQDSREESDDDSREKKRGDEGKDKS